MILQKYKMVFGGTMGAGKSTAIRALSEIEVLTTEALNTDVNAHSKMETTVGIDYGEITLADGTKIGLYGTPGQERFGFMWSVICKGAIGSIILIDHSTENPLQDLEYYVNAFKAHSQNIVVAITHVDDKEERPTTIYRDWQAKKQYNFPLFFVDAREREHILLLVESLVATVEVNLGTTT